MVAAVSTTPASRHQKHPSPARRPPLTLSEKDNATVAAAAAVARRPRTKEISSRYLSSFGTLSSSSLSSTSTSYSTNTTFSSSSSSSSLSSRRFPSPLVNPRPSTPSALLQSSAASKRAHSVDRARPSTPRAAAAPAEPPSAATATRALCTTTRSLSVSFQGESFFYQTSLAKTASPSRARKPSPTPTPERRRASAVTPWPTRAGNHSENARPLENHHHRWPGAVRPQASNPLRKSLDCSSERQDPISATIRLSQQSIVFDDRTRSSSFDGTVLSVSSDTESASSGSNSGATEYSFPSRPKAISRGLSVPARFLQETNSRLRRLPEPTSPLSGPAIQPKTLLKNFSMETSCSSPSSHSSPLRGPIRPSSPSRTTASPMRSMASPLRARNSTAASSSPGIQPANAPSIISFAAEVRRAKKGENRIEEAHLLRLFDNRNLQWRVVNARIDTLLLQQMLIAEKYLFNGWMTTSVLRDSVTTKRIRLQLLTQNLKLTSVLKLQMSYLEEWSLLEREHSNSLSGATEALRASTLKLPVGGAKADIQEVKKAICSAVDVMQVMASSIPSLISKVEGTSSLISEIAAMTGEERALLERSRDLLSMVGAMHVTQCSLKGRIIQLKRRASKTQV